MMMMVHMSHHSLHVLLLCLTLDSSESERVDETKRDESDDDSGSKWQQQLQE